MKHLLCKLNKIPYHPEVDMKKEEDNNKFIILRLILTDITISRFVMNVLIPELSESETGLQFIHLKETCPSLVIGGILFSREGNKTLKTVRNDRIGKKHFFLKRAIIGTGFMSIQQDAVVRWSDSVKRSPRTSDAEDRELQIRCMLQERPPYVTRDCYFVEQPKPEWLAMSTQALKVGCFRSEVSLTERQAREKKKRRRTSGKYSGRFATSDSDEDSLKDETVDESQVALVRITLQTLTSFLNKSRRLAKDEGLKSGLFVLHHSLNVKLEKDVVTGSFFYDHEVVENSRTGEVLPECERAFGNSSDAKLVYEKNQRLFEEVIRSRVEMLISTSYAVTVGREEKRVRETFSCLRIAKSILCGLMQVPEIELLAVHTNSIQCIYKFSTCIREIFLDFFQGGAVMYDDESQFPILKAGYLSLNCLVPSGECLNSYIKKRSQLSRKEYELMVGGEVISNAQTSSSHSSSQEKARLTEDADLGIRLPIL